MVPRALPSIELLSTQTKHFQAQAGCQKQAMIAVLVCAFNGAVAKHFGSAASTVLARNAHSIQ
jgi:hypothetical protein